MSASTTDDTPTDDTRPTGSPPRPAPRLPAGPDPRPPAATFAGDVEIDLTVDRPVTSITLNAAELEITSAELNDGDPDSGYALAPTSIDLDPDEERVTLVFAGTIDPGPARCTCRSPASSTTKLHGFYRSTFTATTAPST